MQQKRTVIDLVDDLDGTLNATTVTFGLDGHHFEIELGPRNEAKLRKFLSPYVEGAREVRARGRRGKNHDPASIRAWATENGLEVGTHGRVPAAIVEQYDRAHRNGTRR